MQIFIFSSYLGSSLWKDLLPIIIGLIGLITTLVLAFYGFKVHQSNQLKISAKYEAFKSFFEKNQTVYNLINEILVEFQEFQPITDETFIKNYKTWFINRNLIPIQKAFKAYYSELELWECFLYKLEDEKTDLKKESDLFLRELYDYTRSRTHEEKMEFLIKKSLKIRKSIMNMYKMVYNELLSEEFDYEMEPIKAKKLETPFLTRVLKFLNSFFKR